MQEVSTDLVGAYASVFVHCWDRYAVQQRDGSYWRREESLTLPLLAGHVAGRWSLGTYLLDWASRCTFAVFDADQEDGLIRLAELSTELAGQGIPSLLEASRRGGHLWVHLAQPTPAHVVRAWLLPYALAYDVEFYPKQDVLPVGGCGSLIRLPLGVHRRSRGWYPFVVQTSLGEWVPVGNTVEECCAWACEQVQRVPVPLMLPVSAALSGSETAAHEGITAPIAPMASHMGGERPGRGAIRAWCRSQDIVAVIGQYVDLDGRGVGSCPFKEHHRHGDRRPSFQVFGGDDPHWFCYTWGRAGDLFDFLCLYHGLSREEGWYRLQAGMLG
jgi:hypothetical protein